MAGKHLVQFNLNNEEMEMLRNLMKATKRTKHEVLIQALKALNLLMKD